MNELWSLHWLAVAMEPVGVRVITAVIFGLIVGSFINVVVLRLPEIVHRKGDIAAAIRTAKRLGDKAALKAVKLERDTMEPLSLSFPGSHCEECGELLHWYDNIPVISWLILLGKCRYCRESIGLRYPAIEIASAMIAVIAAIVLGATAWALGVTLAGWALLAVVLMDVENRFIPQNGIGWLMWGGLILAGGNISPVTPQSAVMGGLLGFIVWQGAAWLYGALRRSESLLWHNLMLLPVLGVWVGASLLPYALVALAVCSVLVVPLNKAGLIDDWRRVPLSPFVAAVMWGALLVM